MSGRSDKPWGRVDYVIVTVLIVALLAIAVPSFVQGAPTQGSIGLALLAVLLILAFREQAKRPKK